MGKILQLGNVTDPLKLCPVEEHLLITMLALHVPSVIQPELTPKLIKYFGKMTIEALNCQSNHDGGQLMRQFNVTCGIVIFFHLLFSVLSSLSLSLSLYPGGGCCCGASVSTQTRLRVYVPKRPSTTRTHVATCARGVDIHGDVFERTHGDVMSRGVVVSLVFSSVNTVICDHEMSILTRC